MTNGTLTALEQAIPIAVAGVVVGKTLETLEPKKKKKGKKQLDPLAL